MGLAFQSAVSLKPEPSPARFRTAPRTGGHDDPIARVDAVVRTVLAELNPPLQAREESDCELFLDKLLSVRHVEALPHGARQVRIGPGTVVTPMARDLLKSKGVAIRLGADCEVQNRARGHWAFAVEAEDGLALSLRRSFLEDPNTWVEVEPSLSGIGGWLTAEGGRGALWITSEVALAVWRACRLQGVRAASAVEPADVHRALRSLGVNLLLIDPAGKSISWIRRMASAFRSRGAPVAPDSILAETHR